MIPAYADWSPAQLAHAVGYRIDLRSHGMSGPTAYLVSAAGKARPVGHGRACDLLSRLAAYRGVDPARPAVDHPRALLDGQPQVECAA